MMMKIPSEKELHMLSEATFRKTADVGLKNAEANQPYIGKTIKDLKREMSEKPPKPAIVISAGPSLHRKRSIETIKKANGNCHIIAVDGALGHCLRNGVIPDFVITVDPDEHRIIRWFGDPRLDERPEDDYFRRQDLDPALNTNELARNRELIQLVNSYGPGITTIISTSVTPEITLRCRDAGMRLYWWNPLYDDYEKSDSVSRKIYQMNHVTCMVTGGNVGSSAWVFAHSILNSPDVVLVGMDFSYPPGTNVLNTQYYTILKELFPDQPSHGLIEIHNPYLNETWLTDPGYYWYSQCFLQMAPHASCKTYNCTEGGILFGEGIVFSGLADTLQDLLTKKEHSHG
ncbi:MAG: 6-hydroxymethylpterin diphosphokinase MptE-like protein [Dissulfurispiraceae bacterium]